MAEDSVSSVESKQDTGYGKGGTGTSPGAGAVLDVGTLTSLLLKARGLIFDRVGSTKVFRS